MPVNVSARDRRAGPCDGIPAAASSSATIAVYGSAGGCSSASSGSGTPAAARSSTSPTAVRTSDGASGAAATAASTGGRTGESAGGPKARASSRASSRARSSTAGWPVRPTTAADGRAAATASRSASGPAAERRRQVRHQGPELGDPGGLGRGGGRPHDLQRGGQHVVVVGPGGQPLADRPVDPHDLRRLAAAPGQRVEGGRPERAELDERGLQGGFGRRVVGDLAERAGLLGQDRPQRRPSQGRPGGPGAAAEAGDGQPPGHAGERAAADVGHARTPPRQVAPQRHTDARAGDDHGRRLERVGAPQLGERVAERVARRAGRARRGRGGIASQQCRTAL